MKTKNFFEPWTAKPRQIDVRTVDTSDLSEGDAAEINSLLAAAALSPDYVVWGSGLWQAGPSLGLLGDRGRQDGGGVIVTIHPVKNMGSPLPPADVAGRVCECVNALRGVDSPQATLEAVRELLNDMAVGLTDRDDPRVTGLLWRLGAG